MKCFKRSLVLIANAFILSKSILFAFKSFMNCSSEKSHFFDKEVRKEDTNELLSSTTLGSNSPLPLSC
jgi:hypothetical protein